MINAMVCGENELSLFNSGRVTGVLASSAMSFSLLDFRSGP
jgi:hypothetical protein